MHWGLEDEWAFPEQSNWVSINHFKWNQIILLSEPDDPGEEYEVPRQIIDTFAEVVSEVCLGE